jgi:hypothetical protein
MSIIYINIDKNRIYKKEKGVIERLEKVEYSKNDIITSSIDSKDILSFTFKLPITIPKEQLYTEAEIHFFENSGIDLEKNYITHYIVKGLEQEQIYIVEAFSIEEEVLHQNFKNIIHQTEFIDFITLPIFAFKEFYPLYEKEPQRDAFVYLDETQSFIVVFENGEYLYSKTLNNLNMLLKTLDIDYKTFVKIVSEKGLKKENYEIDELLIAGEIERFFNDYFLAINNRLSYGKNIFYLDAIDNIYFYTPFVVEGIDELKTFWDATGINFNIVQGIDEDIDFLDYLVLNFNEKHYKDNLNFSIFPRPPKFYKTRTFQLFLVIFFTALLFGGDYFYRYLKQTKSENYLATLNSEINKKENEINRLNVVNRAILQEYETYSKELNDIKRKLLVISDILKRSLELIKTPKVNKNFITITKLLQKNSLNSFLVSKDKKGEFAVGVYTELVNRKQIASFMNDLFEKGFKDIRTESIVNVEEKYYVSIIRFKL